MDKAKILTTPIFWKRRKSVALDNETLSFIQQMKTTGIDCPCNATSVLWLEKHFTSSMHVEKNISYHKMLLHPGELFIRFVSDAGSEKVGTKLIFLIFLAQ